MNVLSALLSLSLLPCLLRLRRGCALRSLAVLLLGLLVYVPPVMAVRVASVYSAEVDLPAGNQGMNRAFDAALSQVLVKVSGLENLGTPTARRSLVPDAASLVQQYSRLADNRLRVEFDGVALSRVLDNAQQPVWGEERPLVAVWYAMDGGNGRREILSGDAEPGRRGVTTEQDLLREQVIAAADARGLPIVLPLVDAEDLATVSFSDIWGDFREPVLSASRRYGASLALIGRARSLSPDDRRVRWTLSSATDHVAWDGSVSEGPARAAEYLSQRLATYADASGALRVVVADVGSLDAFGELTAYFRSLNIVESAAVAGVNDDRVEFELVVRGDAARLSRTLESGGLLARVADVESVGVPLGAGRRPDLRYRWVTR